MKRIIALFTFVLMATLPSISHADQILSPGAVELSFNRPTPYPPIISQPINVLPDGFDTITTGYDTYYYLNGNFYQKVMYLQKYIQIAPPVGVVVKSIPNGYSFMMGGNGYYIYVFNNVFYIRTFDGYMVVPPITNV